MSRASDSMAATPRSRMTGLDYKPGNANEWKSVLPFVEIRGKQQTVLVAGRLVEKTVGDAKEYFVVAECEPFRKDLDVVIGSGCVLFPAKMSSTLSDCIST